MPWPLALRARCPTLAKTEAEIPWLLAEAEMMVDDDQWLMMVNDYV